MKTFTRVSLSVLVSVLAGCSGEAPKPSAPPPPPAAPAPKVEEKKAEAPAPKAETKTDTPAPAPAPLATGAPKTVSFGKDIKRTMEIPGTWIQEEPENNMRALQLRIPHHVDNDQDAELTVFRFSMGGGAEKNIERWKGQMGGGEDVIKEQKTIKTAAGIEATVVQLQGTYTGMAPKAGGAEKKAPMGDAVMLGAVIVTTDDGEYYIKYVGQRETVELSKGSFIKMIESFK